MENIKFIGKDEPFLSLITKFRDKTCNCDELKIVYRNLGSIFAIKLSEYIKFNNITIVTPLEKTYIGSECDVNNELLFVSTFEDNENFAKVIGDFYGAKEYAKLDVDRVEKGWSASLINCELPTDISNIKTIIFCKSVLATGCTAKTIIKKICEVCNPESIVILALISSSEAIKELQEEYRFLNIKFLIGQIDSLDVETGLLVPGVGMIENRLKAVDSL